MLYSSCTETVGQKIRIHDPAERERERPGTQLYRGDYRFCHPGMAAPSLPFMIFQAALLSLLAASAAPQECNVHPEETPPGAAMGTGLLQTKPPALALENTGFEESMLKAMGKLEEELKDLKAKDTGLVEARRRSA
eukprot:s5302_g3.t1